MWNKRRGGLRQKPWNKVQRREKFWIPDSRIRTAAQNTTFATTGAPGYLVFWDPFSEATEGVASFNFAGRGLSRQKIHRMDGYIRAWCAAHGFGSNVPPDDPPFVPPWVVLDYVWMVLDKAADTHDAGSFPATNLDPKAYSSGDLFELLQRDDILRWGSALIKPTWLPIQVGAGAVVQGMAHQRGMGTVARIPFPRIGKLGLNIPRGKALACIAAGRNLADGEAGFTIDDALEEQSQFIVTESTFRVLVS